MKNTFKLLALLIALVIPLTLHAQTATTVRTLNSAVSDTRTRVINLDAATGVTASTNTVGQYAFVDREAMKIEAVTGTGTNTQVTVSRGEFNTKATPHLSSASVYVGPRDVFIINNNSFDIPVGKCTRGNLTYAPLIHVATGVPFDCVNGRFMAMDGMYFVPWTACMNAESANGNGTRGYLATGASNIGTITSITNGAGNNIFVCNISPPSKIRLRGASLIDIVFFYGVQTNALGTQASVLASGTLNGTIVFGQITMPTPGSSETASTVAPVRADAGSMTLTPTVGNFNTATTTAGAFYSEKIAPDITQTFDMSNDLIQYLATITLVGNSSGDTVNSPGLIVHYAYIPSM